MTLISFLFSSSFFLFLFFKSQMHTPLKQRSEPSLIALILRPPTSHHPAWPHRAAATPPPPRKVLFLFYVTAQFSLGALSCFPFFEASPCALNCSPLNPSGPLFCLSVLLFPPALSEICSEAVGLAALQLFGTSNGGAKHFSC